MEKARSCPIGRVLLAFSILANIIFMHLFLVDLNNLLKSTNDLRNIYNNTYTIPPVKPIFEADTVNCVVKRLEKQTELMGYLKRHPPANTRCTLNYFHDYFKKNGFFYGKGAWDMQNIEYMPADCTLSNHTGNALTFSKVLARNNISKILLTGDSTAGCMFPNLVNSFNGWKCIEERNSSHTEDSGEYFLTQSVPKDLFYHSLDTAMHKGVRTDVARTYKCTLLNERTVYLEYISMKRLVHDTTMMIKEHDVTGGKYQYTAANKLEFLLRHYFPHQGFPDIWLFKLPFRHELWWTTPSTIRIDIEHMIQLMGLHLPAQSRLVFMADSRECTDTLPAHIKENWATKSKTLRNPMLHLYNQIFYEVFSELSNRVQNMYAFLDDMRLSCAMVCDFNKDPGHFADVYYARLSKYILESI